MKTTVKILIGVIALLILAAGAAAVVILTADPYKKAETAFVTELIPFSANAVYMDGYSGAYDVSFESKDSSALFWLGDINLGVFGEYQINAASQRVTMSLTDGTDSIGGEFISDGGKKTLIMFPEFSKYVYAVESENELSLPELDTLSLIKTGSAVSDIYFTAAEENGVYDNEEIISGGETFKCETFTIDFTGEAVYGILSDSIDEVKKNESLMDYMNTAFEMANSDFEERIDELLDRAEETLYDKIGGDTLFTMKVYIYKGRIIGRRIDNIYDSEDEVIEFFDTEKDGERTQRFTYKSAKDSEGARYAEYKYQGDFTEIDGKYTGVAELEVKMSGDDFITVTADVEDFKYYPVGGFSEGTIEIKAVSDNGYYNVSNEYEIVLQKDGNTQNAEISVSSSFEGEKQDVGKMNISVTIDPENPEIIVPDIKEEYLIDINNPNEAKTDALLKDFLIAEDKLDHNGMLYKLIETFIAYF